MGVRIVYFPLQGYSEGARTLAPPEQIASTLLQREAEITEAHVAGQEKACQIREREPKKVPLDELKATLAKVLAPMVESDQGELFLVSADEKQVTLHLRGRFAGCPGNGFVADHIISPLVQAVIPDAEVEISSGAILPEGATRISPNPTAAESTRTAAESTRTAAESTRTAADDRKEA